MKFMKKNQSYSKRPSISSHASRADFVNKSWSNYFLNELVDLYNWLLIKPSKQLVLEQKSFNEKQIKKLVQLVTTDSSRPSPFVKFLR